MKILLTILFFVVICNSSVPWSGIISPDRAIDWSSAGVGGIPERSKICATISPPSNVSVMLLHLVQKDRLFISLLGFSTLLVLFLFLLMSLFVVLVLEKQF